MPDADETVGDVVAPHIDRDAIEDARTMVLWFIDACEEEEGEAPPWAHAAYAVLGHVLTHYDEPVELGATAEEGGDG